MAVIIANMDIPKSCRDCNILDELCMNCMIDQHYVGVNIGNNLTTRDKYCPLKSTDEMIADIEPQESEVEDGNDLPSYKPLTM